MITNKMVLELIVLLLMINYSIAHKPIDNTCKSI